LSKKKKILKKEKENGLEISKRESLAGLPFFSFSQKNTHVLFFVKVERNGRNKKKEMIFKSFWRRA